MFGIKLGTVDVSEHYDKWMSALIELEKEEAESEADTNLWTAHTFSHIHQHPGNVIYARR